MFRQDGSSPGEPILESIMNNGAYPVVNSRAQMMSEANRMIQTARAGSPGPERVSTISQPRSGTISPVSAHQNSQPRPGTVSSLEVSSGAAQRRSTTSPVSAHRHVQSPPNKVLKVGAHSNTRRPPYQKSAKDTSPKIPSRPVTPHISSLMKPLPKRPEKTQASSKIMPRLEKLANSHVRMKSEAGPRSTTPVDFNSEMIPYPERVLMGTPCLRLDMPPEEDSEYGEDSPVDPRREKLTKSDTASRTNPVRERLPSFRFSKNFTSQRSLRSAMRLTGSLKADSIPQAESGTEKTFPKNLRTDTKSPGKPEREKLPTAKSEHGKLFTSCADLKVNTLLKALSRTDKDTEKALPAKPHAAPSGALSDFFFSQMSHPREIALIFLVCLLQLIPPAALTICFPISSIIAGSFKIKDPSVVTWSVAAYATTFGTFILVSGRLGDIFGHKKLVIVGFVMMTPWSILAGISHMVSPVLFFFARAMQGVAASLMVPNGLALLGRMYAPGSKMKIISFSLFGLCVPLGAYLGMLFAAIFAEFVGWPLIFFMLAGISLLCAIACRVLLIPPPPTPAQMRPFKEKLGDMDWLGAFTGVAGLICVQVAFVSAPAAGWGTSWVFMLLIMGVLLVAGFVIVETKIAEHPLVPFKIMTGDMALVLAAVACGWAGFGIWLWYLWRYLLGIRHHTPVESAVQVLPIVPVTILISVLTAYLMRTTKPAYTLLYASFAATLAPFLLYFAAPTQTYWGCTFFSLLVMPIFMVSCLPAAAYLMSNLFPANMQGVSGSLIATVLNCSITLGLGLATTADVHTSHGPTPQLTGIHGAWLTGVGISAFGVLICAAYLFKSTLRPPPPSHPIAPTPHPTKPPRPAPPSRLPTRSATYPLRKPSSLGPPPPLSRPRHPSSAATAHRSSTTNLGFAISFPQSPAHHPSGSSGDSSLFPQTGDSNASVDHRPRQPDPNPRDTLTTALPQWRDHMLPPYDGHMVHIQGRGPRAATAAATTTTTTTTRYQQAQRVHVSQQARFLQGRRA